MTVLDWLLLGGVLLALALAVRACVRGRADDSGCCGDCARCGQGCGKQAARK